MFTLGGNYGNSSYICAGDEVVVDADDFILMPGQSVYYVYHTGDNDVDVNDIPIDPSDVVTLGSFLVNDFSSECTEVYVTAFGATNDGAGGPDFDDPCISWSNTLTVTLLAPVTVTTDEDCDTNTGEFTYQFSLEGGLPECVATENYTVTGAFFNGDVAYGETVSVGPITDGENYDITATDANNCSGSYSNAIQCEKLPVELIAFTGKAIAEGNKLNWTTAAEIENDYFTVEFSADGITFELLDRVNGMGTNPFGQSYELMHNNVASTIIYYRLSQTDFDGSTARLSTIVVQRENDLSFTVNNLYPIPVNNELNINYTVKSDTEVTFQVNDILGRLMINKNTNANAGINSMQFNTQSFKPGVYFLSLNVGDKIVTKRFIVE